MHADFVDSKTGNQGYLLANQRAHRSDFPMVCLDFSIQKIPKNLGKNGNSAKIIEK